MERLDADVGSADAALQQRPEVLQAVGVNLAVHVRYGVVDDLMRVVGFQPFVRQQRIGVERGTGFNVLSDFGLKRAFLPVRDYGGADLAAALPRCPLRRSCLCRQCQ